MTTPPRDYFDFLREQAEREAAGPMPELCHHEDPSWCGPDCEEKIRKFDKWIRRNVKDVKR
jgi:hypothetical protein